MGMVPAKSSGFSGDIDVVTAPSLEAALRVAFAERCTVVVDITDVTFVASAGIAELVRARIRLRSVDGDLVVMNAQPYVRHAFALCGLQTSLATNWDRLFHVGSAALEWSVGTRDTRSKAP